MISTVSNPFITDMVVTPDKFFGRKELLASAIRFLTQPQYKMFFVNGPRCIGKSSLLRKLKHDLLQQGHVPVLIDLDGKASEPMPQILFDMMTAMDAEIKNSSGLSIGDFQEDFRVFDRKYLPSIAPSLGKMVLLFDEFDVPNFRELIREDPACAESAYLKLFPYLHSLVEQAISLRCIVASGRSSSDLSEHYEPVKACSLCELVEGFDVLETTELINALSAGTVRFSAEAIGEIQRLTMGLPHFVQCLAGSAFDHAAESQVSEIDRPDIEGRLASAVQKCGASISGAVKDLLPQQRVFLILIAKLHERGLMATDKVIINEFKQLGMDATQADLTRATSGLVDEKILVFSRNFTAYSFFAMILEKWFAREYTMKSITAELTRDDRRFDDPLRLAKIWYNEKQYAKAAALFRSIAERFPERFEAYYGLALTLEAEGKSPESEVIAAFEKAYRLNPDRARRAYKSVLKRVADKDRDSPVLEKLVDLGDSTIEDRKRLLASYFEMWRAQITEGHFDHFQTALKTKPWLLKEYQAEIIRFVDDVINEITQVNPFIAHDFIISLKDVFDGVQHHIWQVRIEGRLKKASNRTTEIHSIPQDLLRPQTVETEVKQPVKEMQWANRKRSSARLLGTISFVLVLAIAGAIFLHRPVTGPKPVASAVQAPSLNHVPDPLPEKQVIGVSKQPDASPVKTEVEPKLVAAASASSPTTLPALSRPSVAPAPSDGNTIKSAARIMLINASSMYQKGLAAKSRDRLIKNGFPSNNILTGNNKEKVSRAYAYYSAKEYVPVIKEALGILYPGKEDGFFDISSKDRTVNGWIKNYFKDENLHILIRMPNTD